MCGQPCRGGVRPESSLRRDVAQPVQSVGINQTKQKYQEILKAQSKGVLKTEIGVLSKFFLAEDYHQKYLHKNPNGYCGLKGLNIKYF